MASTAMPIAPAAAGTAVAAAISEDHPAARMAASADFSAFATALFLLLYSAVRTAPFVPIAVTAFSLRDCRRFVA